MSVAWPQAPGCARLAAPLAGVKSGLRFGFPFDIYVPALFFLPTFALSLTDGPIGPQRPAAGVDLHPTACNSAGGDAVRGDAVTAHLRVHSSPSTLYRRRPVLAQATR